MNTVLHNRYLQIVTILLLVQAGPEDDDREWSSQWRRVWEGNRPRDRERYRLYVHASTRSTP